METGYLFICQVSLCFIVYVFVGVCKVGVSLPPEAGWGNGTGEMGKGGKVKVRGGKGK